MKEFRIDYFTKPSDPRWPSETYPHFQLAHGDVGGTRTVEQDDGVSHTYSLISSPTSYETLERDVVQFLRSDWGFRNTWQLSLPEPTSEILEEDIGLLGYKGFLTLIIRKKFLEIF